MSVARFDVGIAATVTVTTVPLKEFRVSKHCDACELLWWFIDAIMAGITRLNAHEVQVRWRN